jgi:hypothetical protein
MKTLIGYIEGVGELRGWARLKRAIGVMVLIILPSYLISYLSLNFLPQQDPVKPIDSIGWLLFALTVGPLAETYLMRFFIFVLRKFIQGALALCTWVAFLCGALHGFNGWGLYAVWPFFVMSVCYLKWEKTSVTEAMVGTTLLHIALNAVGTLVLVAQLQFSS